jgi:DNA invertase Pin-like site-specific DNA recombinase
MHNRRMIYGYARVSSNGQDLAQQLAQLDAAGCTKVYREKISGATAERPQLKRAIGALDAGDVLMVTSTDRLARNTRDLLNILHAVKEAGAGFRSIAEPMVDTTSQFADVIIAVLGVAASYERHRITERTAAGRVQAKARGVKFGRRAALTPHQQSEALQRLAAGDTQRTVAALLGVSQATISRIATPAVQRTTGALSPSTEAWSKAALDAGNRADHDPEYAYEIGKRLF